MDHSSLRGEKIATRSKLRKRALELFVISDTFQQYRRQMVIDIAMKIGSIHLLNKEYEYSYSDYARVIIQLEKQKKLSVDMRMNLAEAYLEIGRAIPYIDDNYPPTYYLGKMTSIECYHKACDMIRCLLKEDRNNHAFWKLYKSATHRIGKVYFKEHIWEEALYWFSKHLASIEKLNSVDKYEEYAAHISVGDTHVSMNDAEQALIHYQNAYRICCDYNLDRFEILQKLISFPATLVQNRNELEKEYDSIVKTRKEYGDAYQEVLEILKHTEAGAVAKIPKEKLKLFHERQNKDHGFRADPTKTLDEQGVMKRTKAILAIIFRDYWASDKQRETIEQHEDRERMENRVKLMEEVIDHISLVSSSNKAITKISSQAYSEVFWLLEHFPSSITGKMPVDILMDIKTKRDRSYVVQFSPAGDNKYLEDTLGYMRSLLDMYMPDAKTLLVDLRKSVPSDFDLNCIFEEDFE